MKKYIRKPNKNQTSKELKLCARGSISEVLQNRKKTEQIE